MMLQQYFHWKKAHREPNTEQIFFDFYEIQSLMTAEQTFYKIGVSIDEARMVLEEQLVNLTTLARYIVAHLYAMVLDEPTAVTNKSFVTSIELDRLSFNPNQMAADYAAHAGCTRALHVAGWMESGSGVLLQDAGTPGDGADRAGRLSARSAPTSPLSSSARSRSTSSSTRRCRLRLTARSRRTSTEPRISTGPRASNAAV